MKITDLFELNYGQKEYHNKENLCNGETLLISSQAQDNGAYGFFDIETNYQPPFISVPSTGSIGEAFVQTKPCCVDDNCLILIPKSNYPIEYLFYVASIIRKHKWRFMYGRQITPERLGRIEILDNQHFKTKLNFQNIRSSLTPKKQSVKEINTRYNKKTFLISNLFNVNSGEYHSINELHEGKIPLVSCSDLDNGISGFYDIPEENTHQNCITIAYDGKPLTAKYHNYKFSAYDNVGVLTPIKNMKKTTLLFITIILNIERWRYGYGRKCYKQKLERLEIKLPAKTEGKIDEETIEEIMKNRDLLGYFND
ncbi:MAG: restriction endonuclease subunit S [Candidatus Pacearchaeota archaeon]